jgi:hypothetical protein
MTDVAWLLKRHLDNLLTYLIFQDHQRQARHYLQAPPLKMRKKREKALPFFRHIPAYSETACGKTLCKIPCAYAGFVNLSAFSRFFRKSARRHAPAVSMSRPLSFIAPIPASVPALPFPVAFKRLIVRQAQENGGQHSDTD